MCADRVERSHDLATASGSAPRGHRGRGVQPRPSARSGRGRRPNLRQRRPELDSDRRAPRANETPATRRIASRNGSSSPSRNRPDRAAGPDQHDAAQTDRAGCPPRRSHRALPDATLTTTMTAYLDAYSVGIRAPEVTLHNGWPLSCGRAKAYHDSCRSIPPARRKPAAVSFSGLLDGQRV